MLRTYRREIIIRYVNFLLIKIFIKIVLEIKIY